jgi:hypothetical protein
MSLQPEATTRRCRLPLTQVATCRNDYAAISQAAGHELQTTDGSRGNLPSAILCAFLLGLLCGIAATEFYALFCLTCCAA